MSLAAAAALARLAGRRVSRFEPFPFGLSPVRPRGRADKPAGPRERTRLCKEVAWIELKKPSRSPS
jgi:hypothetical protein